MALSTERQQVIREMANDEWIDRLYREVSNQAERDARYNAESAAMEEATQRFVAEATDPEELHYFAENWNWDGGAKTMLALTRNPACDAGTALMVYWLAQPEFDTQYASRDEIGPEPWNDDQRDGYDLVKELEARILAGDFATRLIPFDPRTSGLVNGLPPQAKRELPSEVYEAVTGEKGADG